MHSDIVSTDRTIATFDDADITILEENGKPVKGKARDEAIKQMRQEQGESP